MCAAACPGAYGCSHYKRRCQLLCSVCLKYYVCRFCHDESESINHTMNRNEVDFVKCMTCNHVQKVQQTCNMCSTNFGKYFCKECCLYDDEDLRQFHCDKCGLCRQGGEHNYFHCPGCNMCLNITLIDNHQCVENVSHSECPICMEDLHTSRKLLDRPSCGHLIHLECKDKMKEKGHCLCPICRKKIDD